jgi:hypothetical protein
MQQIKDISAENYLAAIEGGWPGSPERGGAPSRIRLQVSFTVSQKLRPRVPTARTPAPRPAPVSGATPHTESRIRLVPFHLPS